MYYRPDGWVNPNKILIINPVPEGSDPTAYTAFEEGADAMYQPAYDKGKADGKKELLESLRAEGRDVHETYPHSTENGTIVFIPDVEEA